MLRSVVALGMVLLVAACSMDDKFVSREKIAAWQATEEQTLEMIGSPTALQQFLSNTTTKGWDAHGTQIEYLAADGRTFLWYPGNVRPVSGRWKLQMGRRGLQMCFLYGSFTYNPLTRERGGKWECGLAIDYLFFRDEIVDGDPLRLAKGVPFVMPRDTNMSIAQAMSMAGFGSLRTPNKAMAPQHPSSN